MNPWVLPLRLADPPAQSPASVLVGYGAALNSFAEVIAASTQVGGAVVIDLGGGDTITLQSVTLASLTAGDFVFG